MSNEPKLYRIEWQEENEDGSTYTERNYFISDDISKNTFEKEVSIREVSKEEEEAYISGYEDGFDVATVANRMTEDVLTKVTGATPVGEAHEPNEEELADIFRSDDLNL